MINSWYIMSKWLSSCEYCNKHNLRRTLTPAKTNLCENLSPMRHMYGMPFSRHVHPFDTQKRWCGAFDLEYSLEWKGLFVCCHWWLAQLTPTLAHSLQGNTVATCCIRSEVRYAQPQPVVAHCVPGLILSFFSGKHAGWTYLVSVNGFFILSSTRLWSSLRYDRVRFDDDTLCEVPFESSGNLPQGWRTLSLHTKTWVNYYQQPINEYQPTTRGLTTRLLLLLLSG